MHQSARFTIRALGRGTAAALASGIAIALLWGAVAASAAARRLVSAELERVGARLNGRVALGGLRGTWTFDLRLDDVTFHAHRSAPALDPRLVSVAHVLVDIDWTGLLTGGRLVEGLTFVQPAVSVRLDENAGAHRDWIAWLFHDAQREGGAPEGERASRRTPPLVTLVDATFALDDPSGRYPSAGCRAELLSLDVPSRGVAGTVLIEGVGRGTLSGTIGGAVPLALTLSDRADLMPLLALDAPESSDAELSIAGISLSWPPAIALEGVEVRNLDLALPRPLAGGVDAVHAESVRVIFGEAGAVTDLRSVGVSLANSASTLDVQRILIERSWAQASVAISAELVDPYSGTATVVIEHDLARGASHVAVSANRFDVLHVASVLPLPPDTTVGGTFTGEVSVSARHDTEEGSLSLDGSLDDLSILSPIVSRRPLAGMSAELQIEASLAPERHATDLERLRVYLPRLGVFVTASGHLAPEGLRASVIATMPQTPAEELARALPLGIAEVFDGFEFSGRIGFEARAELDTVDVERARATFALHTDGFEVTRFGPSAPIDTLNSDDFSLWVRTFDGTTRAIGPATAEWAPLASLPALAPRAVVAAEDDRFWDHSGFDVAGINAALRMNLAAGRVVRGGSTISQQVVKNLFLNHDRTFARKILEAFLTWQLETHVPKERILELYLNLAHWGRGVYGITSASRAYFGHDPAQLTLRESAFLGAILPNPAVFGEQYAQGVIAPSRRVKMRHILENLHRAGMLTDATLRYHADLVDRGDISNAPPSGTGPVAARP